MGVIGVGGGAEEIDGVAGIVLGFVGGDGGTTGASLAPVMVMVAVSTA